jgi:hypothetical protein
MARKSRLREGDDEVFGYYLVAENFSQCRLEDREGKLRTLRLRCPLVEYLPTERKPTLQIQTQNIERG